MTGRWNRTLHLEDIFRAELEWTEKRDEMVRRIRALDPNEDDGELQCIADSLAEANDTDEWDVAWDEFYDWADWSGIWVATR